MFEIWDSNIVVDDQLCAFEVLRHTLNMTTAPNQLSFRFLSLPFQPQIQTQCRMFSSRVGSNCANTDCPRESGFKPMNLCRRMMKPPLRTQSSRLVPLLVHACLASAASMDSDGETACGTATTAETRYEDVVVHPRRTSARRPSRGGCVAPCNTHTRGNESMMHTRSVGL